MKKKTTAKKKDYIIGEWQLCPKCYGKGYHLPDSGYSMNIAETCSVCKGAKIIQRPIIFN